MGFVYLRDNDWFRTENVIKMGIATNIRSRESTYITGEIKRGKFIKVFQVPDIKLCIIDKCLKRYFKDYLVYRGGGTEFYDRRVIDLIEPYLMKMADVIIVDDINAKVWPRNYQYETLNKMKLHFDNNSHGNIKWACGLGKALLALFYAKCYKKILIGVPSIYLQAQMSDAVKKLFNLNPALIGGDAKFRQARITITTYHSCKLLLGEKYDIKIADEAHHLVGDIENAKMFRLFHNIKSDKTLFMSATLPPDPIFGECISSLSTQWAIENKKITDYNIIISAADSKSSILYVACAMCLKALKRGKLTHLLLYTNTIDDAILANSYLNNIIAENGTTEQIYVNNLHSRSNCNLSLELEKFKLADFGIISCVYLFGEGFDMPELNGVCVAANMQSEVRIVQYLLRPNRLNPSVPNKKASIILPYQKTIPESVIHIIREFAAADPGVMDKIAIDDIIMKEEIMLKLARCGLLDYSEEEAEYRLAKAHNRINGIKSKADYVGPPEYPAVYFKKVWRGWCDFLNDDNVYVSKDEWRKICLEKSITAANYNLEYKKYKLPPDPDEYYLGFTNINNELQVAKPRRGR
jgi:hypothetical protein